MKNFIEFKKEVLADFYKAMHTQETDNYDYQRFSYDGIDRSKIFNSEEHQYFLNWLFENFQNIFKAYSFLEDDESKKIYKELIVYRLLGHLHCKLSFAKKEFSEVLKVFNKTALPVDSIIKSNGIFGGLKKYDFSFNGKEYKINCLENGLISTLIWRQYFFNRNNISILPEEGDFVIDGGACLGDTALVFSNAVGNDGWVYSFDPVEDNLEVFEENLKIFPYKNIDICPCGLSDKNKDGAPIRLNGYAPGFNIFSAEMNNIRLPLRTIDYLVDSGEIEKINFLKLDVEGSEMATLRGARNSIDRFKPKLAISIYHKPDDFFEIINYIKENHKYYKLYVDHYTVHREETVVYGLPY